MSGVVQTPGGKSWHNWRLGDWALQAACRGCDPELWYPPEERGARARNVRAGNAAAAKLICRQCPVQLECLRHALEHGEPWGVWGGATQEERRALALSKPPIPEMDHGTEAGAKAHRRRGEEPCQLCRDAAALASRLRHQKIRARR